MASNLALVLVLLSYSLTTVFAQEYAAAALKAHNEVRNKHKNTGPLVLSNDLNAKALKCAQRNANRGSLEHDCPEAKGFGENLAYNSSPNPQDAVTAAVTKWYAEKKDYNYNNPVFDKKTGHFTQVVWKSSTQVGCGCVKAGSLYYTSCLYSPQGNFKGKFTENVQPEK